jgi:uncharacterized protein YggE
MKKGLVIITGLVLIALMAGSVGCDMYSSSSDVSIPQTIQSNQSIGISVTGTGEISVVPDIAVVNLGVQVQMVTLAEAQQRAADSMAAIMDVLAGYNIADKDIQTVNYNIQPVWTWKDNESILVGYSVTNSVKVKIRNIDDTGSIIDAAVGAGGEYVIINGISFTIDEPENYYEEARTAAMADAKAKATQLAKSGGVKVGSPIYINEGSVSISRPSDVSYAKAEGVSTTSISSGELKVTITVQVVYAIK